jgi:hypothetical protein
MTHHSNLFTRNGGSIRSVWIGACLALASILDTDTAAEQTCSVCGRSGHNGLTCPYDGTRTTFRAPFQKAGIASVAASEGRPIGITLVAEQTIQAFSTSAGTVTSIAAMTGSFIPLAQSQESVVSPIAGVFGRCKAELGNS